MIEKKYPSLRFKKINFQKESVWHLEKINKVAFLNPKNIELDDEFTYIDLESVKKGRLIKNTIIKKQGAPSRAQRVLSDKDVLFQTVRPYQKNHYLFTNQNDTQVVASTGFAQMRAKKNTYPHFLYHLINTERFDFEVMKRCTGTSYPAIKSSDLGTIEIYMPAKEEQKKVADFFTLLDYRLEKQQDKIEFWREYKKGMMQRLFSQELRFKDENGKEFPQWEEKYIEEFSDVSTGRKDTQDKVDTGKYPFFVRSNTIENINSYSFDGEAILTAGDGVGVGKVFHYINGKFDFHQRVYKISDFQGCIAKYIYYYFSENFLREAMKYNAKTSVDSVRREMITKMLVPLPSLKEQEKISDILSAIEMKVNNEEIKLDCLIQQKKGLMQQMFI